MKKVLILILAFALICALTACGKTPQNQPENPEVQESEIQKAPYENATEIILSEDKITVGGGSVEESDCVTVGGKIIYYHDMDYYESGNPYGEGKEKDRHTEEEAAEHTLLTITKPGEYIISGKLKGQIAVDLGENAETDPNAKVTLIFNGADITCEIAPAVIFYNVYECADVENPSGAVDTSSAGANVIIADKSENNIRGAYVAKIYKDNGEAKKLHKYDGAFYSVQSMNISGGEKGDGILNIEAENEGLNSEMHLTVNGGNVNIFAQDDGINTNEDGLSVTTVNGGTLVVKGGLGSEGDGIDSNGWLTVNGGTLYASGNGKTGDGGIDSDMSITINGGTIVAFGSRNDSVQADSKQTCVQLTFSSIRSAGSLIEFVDENGYGMMAESDREFQSLTLAGDNLEKDKIYRLYVNDILQEYSGGGISVVPSPGGFEGDFGRNDRKNPFAIPEGFDEWLENAENIPDDIRVWLESIESALKDRTQDENPPQMPGGEMPGTPQGEQAPNMPTGQTPPAADKNDGSISSISLSEVYPTEFVITESSRSFYGMSDSAEDSRKIRVSFTVNEKDSVPNTSDGKVPTITSVECSHEVESENIQLTLVYAGYSEEITVSKVCLLSDGYDAINKLFEDIDPGIYRLTIAVVSGNYDYTGSTSFDFKIEP